MPRLLLRRLRLIRKLSNLKTHSILRVCFLFYLFLLNDFLNSQFEQNSIISFSVTSVFNGC